MPETRTNSHTGRHNKRDFELCKVVFSAVVTSFPWLISIGADSLHWTLAFHATEQPADPPIGLWKFGRGEFEDANLTLQQRGGYGYTRIARLEVTALSSTEHKNLTTETSSNFQSVHLVDEVADMGPLSPEPLPQPALTMPERRKKSPTKITKKNRNSRPGPRRTGGAQMSPPLTLASSRNTSKDATADEGENLKKYPPNKAGTGISHGTKRSSKSVSRSRLGTKRRPKRPLQLFEDVTSSLPPTQIIGESQSLGHGSQIAKLDQPAGLVNTSTGQDWLVEDIPLSTSLDPSKLLDGVSLSSEALSPTQISPRVDLARLTSRSSNTEYRLRSGAFSDGRGSLRLEPSSSIVGPHEDMRQWELRTSPPVNLLGIAISDDEQDIKKAPEMEHGAPPHPAVGQSERPGISYAFSPHTVTRRTLFHDIHNSSDSEE
ncbi:hypothetical protein C7999DRAFT_40530 [Corynascus novoguineensis]|uniref:Uncharacterized protein n=1 Tax=Corynascus novoguineensis TaxID=1126955 RepID=A0AAN7CTV8_9PEZI|nr:hypothetical protein C7999DRAFT_40530 [Corynascus novoguineensis]